MILPESFTSYTERMMGSGLFSRFVSALSEEPPVSIRVNRRKWSGEPVGGERVPWCGTGYYLSSRPRFTFDPLLHAGCYYVQEASSMFLCRVMEQYVAGPVAVLDMCAAPGGKSTAVLASVPEGSVLVCNEPVRPRASVLAENIAKWGHPGVIVTNNYPADYSASGLRFDVVLCDVPCSGEGMFRKDEGAVGEWSPAEVESCRRLQREIVAEAWACLKPGGLFVYSTCTFNTGENEENVGWICGEYDAAVLSVDIGGEWGITGSLLDGFREPVYRFIPGKTRGEGLFMAVLRKPCGDRPEQAPRQRRNGSAASLQRVNAPSYWLADGGAGFAFRLRGDIIEAVPTALSDIYNTAADRLRVLSAGVAVGRVRGRDIIPEAALALSTALNRGAFPEAELSYCDATAYLRRDAVTLPPDVPRGHVLVTYRGVPLGFVKNIGNRANNLYPQEWRIKSSHAPEMPPEVL